MRPGILLTAILLLFAGSLPAQELVYPTAAQLRSSLLKLIASAEKRYSDIDNGPLDASSPDTHGGNFHLVPGTRNQLYMAAGPARDSYMEFMNEGINEQQAKTGFEKWQKLFEEAMPEFSFLTHDHYTYGEARFYYNTAQTHMFVLEVYFSPVKKNWSHSLQLRHPSDEDKKFIAKKNDPNAGNEIVVQQKAITETLTALLKARTSKFESFRSLEMPGENGGKTFLLKGTAYGFNPGPVEFINVDAAGAASFHLMASGFQMPVQLTVIYATLITPQLQKEGYSITKEESTFKLTYTISYNGIGVSACELEKDKGTLTVVILGK